MMTSRASSHSSMPSKQAPRPCLASYPSPLAQFRDLIVVARDAPASLERVTARPCAAQTLRQAPVEAPAELDRWLADSGALESHLARREAASLFNPGRLRAATRAPLPAKAP